jgi:RNA polymerase sigma-70 factor (ECF subfamily)
MAIDITSGAGPDRHRERRAPARAAVGGGAGDEAVQRAVRAAKAGDWEAIRFLYVRYAEAVRRSVAQLLRDEHEAEDVTQQVFLKLRTAIAQYEPRTTPFRSWLFRVARNVALDEMRARRWVPAEQLEAPTPPGEVPERAGLSALRDALATLPPDQRQVLYLRHVLGLAPGEIAARLGKTESAVHGLHHRGRLALQMELTRLDAAPATRAAREVVVAMSRRRRTGRRTGSREGATRRTPRYVSPGARGTGQATRPASASAR